MILKFLKMTDSLILLPLQDWQDQEPFGITSPFELGITDSRSDLLIKTSEVIFMKWSNIDQLILSMRYIHLKNS